MVGINTQGKVYENEACGMPLLYPTGEPVFCVSKDGYHDSKMGEYVDGVATPPKLADGEIANQCMIMVRHPESADAVRYRNKMGIDELDEETDKRERGAIIVASCIADLHYMPIDLDEEGTETAILEFSDENALFFVKEYEYIVKQLRGFISETKKFYRLR